MVRGAACRSPVFGVLSGIRRVRHLECDERDERLERPRQLGLGLLALGGSLLYRRARR